MYFSKCSSQVNLIMVFIISLNVVIIKSQGQGGGAMLTHTCQGLEGWWFAPPLFCWLWQSIPYVCYQLAPVTKLADWFIKSCAMCYDVCVIMHVKDPYLSVVRVGHCPNFHDFLFVASKHVHITRWLTLSAVLATPVFSSLSVLEYSISSVVYFTMFPGMRNQQKCHREC